MKKNWVIWSIAGLESLFALCAGSVLVYRILGIAFDFGIFSYRVANIVISLLLIFYIINGLFKQSKNVLVWVIIFSTFHLVEGVIIGFWFKVVIHALILITVGIHYLHQRSLNI